MTDSTLTTDSRTRAEKKAALQSAMERLVDVGAAGVQFRVADGDDVFTLAAGSEVIGQDAPVPVDGRFRAACITKVFVSTVLLQLVAEGKLALDAPVERYLPGVLPYGDRVTVRNLMQHTSGLHNHADSFQRPGKRFMRDRYKQYEPAELVAIAAARSLNFEPGSTFEYSNTNYIALGMIIEKVSGASYAVEIGRRILVPLGLRNTYLPGSDPEIKGPHARGYMQIEGRSEDVTLMNPSEAGAAGEVISTAADLDTFLTAVVTGRLLGAAEFTEMTRTIPPEWVPLPMSNGYGLGFMPLETSCGLSLWGHGGGIPGYATFIGSTLDGRKRIVTSITLNIDPDDFSGTFENAVVDALNAAADCCV